MSIAGINYVKRGAYRRLRIWIVRARDCIALRVRESRGLGSAVGRVVGGVGGGV